MEVPLVWGGSQKRWLRRHVGWGWVILRPWIDTLHGRCGLKWLIGSWTMECSLKLGKVGMLVHRARVLLDGMGVGELLERELSLRGG